MEDIIAEVMYYLCRREATDREIYNVLSGYRKIFNSKFVDDENDKDLPGSIVKYNKSVVKKFEVYGKKNNDGTVHLGREERYIHRQKALDFAVMVSWDVVGDAITWYAVVSFPFMGLRDDKMRTSLRFAKTIQSELHELIDSLFDAVFMKIVGNRDVFITRIKTHYFLFCLEFFKNRHNAECVQAYNALLMGGVVSITADIHECDSIDVEARVTYFQGRPENFMLMCTISMGDVCKKVYFMHDSRVVGNIFFKLKEFYESLENSLTDICGVYSGIYQVPAAEQVCAEIFQGRPMSDLNLVKVITSFMAME